MITYQKICLLMFGGIAFFANSCNKYLDKKPNSAMYVPEKWQDFQALLDNNSLMNVGSASALTQVLSDDYYILNDRFESLSPELQGAYIWDDSFKQITDGWSVPYQVIYISNVVLDGLAKVREKIPVKEYQYLEGAALFFRSFSFHYLLQLYSKPYLQDPSKNMGIVLKNNANIQEEVSRATVKDCYVQIINDLKRCIDLLPPTSLNLMRPNATAAKALLARVYLTMSDYHNALYFSELVIKDKPQILDFNTLIPVLSPNMPSFLSNPEIIFFSTLRSNVLTSPAIVIIDSTLYASYDSQDIRKSAYFTVNTTAGVGKYRFKGSFYELSNSSNFYGLTVGEMYLIAAECYARNNNNIESQIKLNRLLQNRYKNGSFIDYDISDPEELLNVILMERRKELVCRGIRWSDIKRLNAEANRNIILRREIVGKSYTLLPNDIKSVLLIPELEITRSGITQNPR